jgi:hypothetical protein
MLDFDEALDRLRMTNFRISQTLIDKLLAEERAKGATSRIQETQTQEPTTFGRRSGARYPLTRAPPSCL